MALPARTRIALALALLLALAATWLAFSGPLLRTQPVPRAEAMPVAASRVEERLDAAEPEPDASAKPQGASRGAAARAKPSERAAVPAPQAPAGTRNSAPRAQPIEGDRLVFTVRNARLRPVTTLQRLDLEYALGAAPATMIPSLASEDGTFACAIRPFRGTIRVHSTSFGDAVAAFPAPENGESRAELVLSCYASIVGRVEHEGVPVADAIVCAQTLVPGARECEARLGCGIAPERCRWLRGEVETDRDGAFVFAVERPGEYVLVARHDPEGAVTSAPVVVEDTHERAPIVLKLAPASRAEIRWPHAPELERERVLSLWGENGLHVEARAGAEDAPVEFDCLPAGTYVLTRPYQGPRDAPQHLELDGSPRSVVREELRRLRTIELELASPAEDAQVTARLYRLGCCADLADEAKLERWPIRLQAGDPGAHLLVLEAHGEYGRPTYRRLVRVTLAEGTNELAPKTLELDGELACSSMRLDIDKRSVHARFVLGDESVLYVPLHEAPRAPREKKPNDVKFLLSGRTPVGTCDLVRLAGNQLEILLRDVHVGASGPTRVTLSAGSAARR